MARASQVTFVEEEPRVTVVLRDIYLCRDDVIDISARRIAAAEYSDRTEWISSEDVGSGPPAPLWRVVQTSTSDFASPALAV